MQRIFERIAQEAEALKELGEELEGRIGALCEEARDELEEVEWRVHHFENDIQRLRQDLREPAMEVARSARALARDVVRGCDALRGAVEQRLDGD